MLGLNRDKVILSPFREEWRQFFEAEKQLLQSATGQYLVSIEHIGSTSVSGLTAKPIIDLVAAVRKLSDAPKCVSSLEKIGYEYRGEQGIPERFYFRKGTETLSTHHLSIFSINSDLWKGHLMFRNYLRQNPSAAEEYGKLKTELALKYKNNRKEYTSAKTSFIENILKMASSTPDSYE